MRLAVRKSVFDSIMKSIQGDKLAYFKKELNKILDKQVSEGVQKSIFESAEEIAKAGYDRSHLVQKVITDKNGHKKTVFINPNKQFGLNKYHEQDSKGSKVAIGKLKAQIDNCKSEEELMQLVLRNKGRFSDENGKPLPIVEELRQYVEDKQNGKVHEKKAKKVNTKKVPEKGKISKNTIDTIVKMADGHSVTRMAELIEGGSLGDGIKHEFNDYDKNDLIRFVSKLYEDNNLDVSGDKKSSEKESGKKAEESGKETEKFPKIVLRRAFNTIGLSGKNPEDAADEIIRKNDTSTPQKRALLKVAKKVKEMIKKTGGDQKGIDAVYESIENDTFNNDVESGKKADDSTVLSNGKTVKEVRDQYGIKPEKKADKKTPEKKFDAAQAIKDYGFTSQQEVKYKGENWNVSGATFDPKTGKPNGIRLNPDRQKGNLKDSVSVSESEMKEIESESEKHENRSEAMKGNQNAYKGGYSDDDISKMKEIREKVNDYFKKSGEKVVPGDFKYDKKLTDMAHRTKDKEVEKLCYVLRDFRGETPDEFQKNYEKRIVQGCHDNKSFSFEENLAGEVGENARYWAAHIDEHPTQGLIEMATLLNLMNENVKEVKDTYSARGISYAVDVLTDMKNVAKNPESFDDVIKGFQKLARKFYPKAENKTVKQEIKQEVKQQEPENPVKEDVQEEMQPVKNHRYVPGYKTSESAVIADKRPIATNKKIGEGEVEMPYSKELETEMKTLNDSVSLDETRKFMNKVYYEGGNLIATDGRRLKVVKVGELEGIKGGSYVSVTPEKSGIKIKKIEWEGTFPDYTRVIPEDRKQKITLNNSVLKDKIKEMYKDGAIDKKIDMVQLELKDGKVLIDDTIVGDAKDVKLKTMGGFREPSVDTNYITVNAKYLTNALTGNESALMVGENNGQSMTISTENTTNVLMPMQGNNEKIDYSSGRQSKKEENERKAKNVEHNKTSMINYMDSLNLSENNIKTVKNHLKNIRNLENGEAIMKNSYESYKKAEKMFNNPSTAVTPFNKLMENRYGFSLLSLANKDPEFKTMLENTAKDYGLDVKKSLFDLIDFDEDEESESGFTDNDASQPELFNSPAYKVGIALEDCFN